jgi:hypothetical protein
MQLPLPVSHVGMREEAKIWVTPLVSNLNLKEAFLSYTKPPLTFEKLKALADYVSFRGWPNGELS